MNKKKKKFKHLPVRYLAQHHAEMLREFQKITDITSLDSGEAS